MNFIILYRDSGDYSGEFDIASKYFKCISRRSMVQKNDFVIGRYSVLPYYKELEEDVNYLGGKLVNSYSQHRYIADLGNYYRDLEGITPKTWNYLDQIPQKGPFVLKGETNSKKFEWDKMMFAEKKDDAIRIYCDLQNDGLIGDQTIYIREYVKLRTLLIGLRNLPITEEYRFFIYNNEVISGGYYWSNYIDEFKDLNLNPNNVPKEFLNEVIERVGKNCNFYVIDVARKQDGDWIVIELNDGQMSGLSENKPEILYKKLFESCFKTKKT
jgi:hypothetical protein